MAKKVPRKPTPPDVEMRVLTRSGRRCALCFYLSGDLDEKLGQIAHLDGDRANYAENNLAFLCMNHHSVYDSTTSQHKNYTMAEAKEARWRLYQAIAEKQHHASRRLRPARVSKEGEADRKTLAALVQLMSMTGSIEFLRDANFAGWSFDWKRLEGIERFITRRGPEYEFLDRQLEKLRAEFVEASRRLLTSLATYTSPVGMRGDRQAVPEDWEITNPKQFKEAVKGIHEGADSVCSLYDKLIRTARRKLES